MTGATDRLVAFTINEAANDIILAIRELQENVGKQFDAHDANLRTEVVHIRKLAVKLLGLGDTENG